MQSHRQEPQNISHINMPVKFSRDGCGNNLLLRVDPNAAAEGVAADYKATH